MSYDAISYVSEKSKQAPRLTLLKSIKLAGSSVKLFPDMQGFKEDLYPGSFGWTKTIGCLITTIDSGSTCDASCVTLIKTLLLQLTLIQLPINPLIRSGA